MNILRILTLNRHGDFEEVLFSSSLSYLLNPQADHGLGHVVLEKIAGNVFPDFDKTSLYKAQVFPEYSLGNAGNIDILVIFDDRILGIEVKIWDNSARNVSKSNEPQLERYCNKLDAEFHDKDWKFVFLIPTTASRTCLSEFNRLVNGKFSNKVKLMTWNPGDPIDNVYNIPKNGYIEKSVLDIIGEIQSEIKRVDMPLNTQWLLDSLSEILPDIVDEIPEPGRFPNRDDLKKLATWPIFEAFFLVGKRWPISLHTAVGIPFGWASERSPLHGNSLYRIRTVTNYYTEGLDLSKYLPGKGSKWNFGLMYMKFVKTKSKTGLNKWV